MTQHKTIMSWSGGKDSSLALYHILQSKNFDVLALLTTITKDYGRISMHGVRCELLEQQVASLGLTLDQIFLSVHANNAEYEAKLEEKLRFYQNQGVSHVAFGDIFLEDLRLYREKNLARIGLQGLFPIWKRDTTELMREFLDLGFRAIVTCVDTRVLDASFSGREIDDSFLADLPNSVDPCGENGEFHSFVFAGPIFRNQIHFEAGEKVIRDEYFCFCDLIPFGVKSKVKQETFL